MVVSSVGFFVVVSEEMFFCVDQDNEMLMI